MTERTPFMAGNWKMNLDRKGGLALASELRDRVGDRKDVEVAIFPRPSTSMSSREPSPAPRSASAGRTAVRRAPGLSPERSQPRCSRTLALSS